MSAYNDFTPQASNGQNPSNGQLNSDSGLENLKMRKMQSLVECLEVELTRARALLDSMNPETVSAADLALLAVGGASQAGADQWVASDEVRQFGLTVAYAVIEAALNEDPTLPECFTADDLVIASDVLAGEMSRGWGQ